MHAQVLAGLALAVACAVGTNLGGLWKYKGARSAREVDVRHPLQSAIALFRSKWWTIGWLVAAAGWLLHVGALALAPISLAQAVISGGLVLLGVIAERWFGFSLGRRQWVGLALVALGMAVLAGTARSKSSHSGYALPALVAFQAAAAGLGVGFILSSRFERLREQHGLMLAVAAGLLFGLSDVSIKAVSGGSRGALVMSPLAVSALIAGVAAFFASARSLQVGDGLAVIAATSAAANMLSIIGGFAVFGDPLGPGTLLVAVKTVAFLLVVAAVGLIPAPVRAQEAIADREAGRETATPLERGAGARPGQEVIAPAAQEG